jgi:hypothetical protein
MMMMMRRMTTMIQWHQKMTRKEPLTTLPMTKTKTMRGLCSVPVSDHSWRSLLLLLLLLLLLPWG